MIPYKSFLTHFNLIQLITSRRNSFNRNHHNLIYNLNSFIGWFLILPLKILDIIGFFIFFNYVRVNIIRTRKLSVYEERELTKVFDNSVDFTKVRIRENSILAKFGAFFIGKSHIGFVMFNCVNFSCEIDCKNNSKDMSWLMHEMVHILQFKHLGIQYIFEALRAQYNGGYDFGGVENLKGKCLRDFNLEQQAEVITKYYNMLMNNSDDRKVLVSFVIQLKNGEF